MNERVSMGGVLGHIRDLGWTPGAVIDIGVERGTRGLYSAWPEAPICLVEPSPRALVYMQQVAQRYPNVHIYNVGASNYTGEAPGRAYQDLVNVAIGGPKTGWTATAFPVMTCDDIVRDAGLQGPFLYKLDTDSHEREVLEGSAETLVRTDVCIVEINVFNSYKGRITPDEMWRTLHDKGFALFDFAGSALAESGLLRTMDLVFVRVGSALFDAAWRRSAKGDAKIRKRIEQQRAALTDNNVIG
jgi:FkbM family methyltransferase